MSNYYIYVLYIIISSVFILHCHGNLDNQPPIHQNLKKISTSLGKGFDKLAVAIKQKHQLDEKKRANNLASKIAAVNAANAEQMNNMQQNAAHNNPIVRNLYAVGKSMDKGFMKMAKAIELKKKREAKEALARKEGIKLPKSHKNKINKQTQKKKKKKKAMHKKAAKQRKKQKYHEKAANTLLKRARKLEAKARHTRNFRKQQGLLKKAHALRRRAKRQQRKAKKAYKKKKKINRKKHKLSKPPKGAPISKQQIKAYKKRAKAAQKLARSTILKGRRIERNAKNTKDPKKKAKLMHQFKNMKKQIHRQVKTARKHVRAWVFLRAEYRRQKHGGIPSKKKTKRTLQQAKKAQAEASQTLLRINALRRKIKLLRRQMNASFKLARKEKKKKKRKRLLKGANRLKKSYIRAKRQLAREKRKYGRLKSKARRLKQKARKASKLRKMKKQAKNGPLEVLAAKHIAKAVIEKARESSFAIRLKKVAKERAAAKKRRREKKLQENDRGSFWDQLKKSKRGTAPKKFFVHGIRRQESKLLLKDGY